MNDESPDSHEDVLAFVERESAIDYSPEVALNLLEEAFGRSMRLDHGAFRDLENSARKRAADPEEDQGPPEDPLILPSSTRIS